MSEYRVSSRYAKSLIELSKEKGMLEQVKEDILLFKNTYDASRDLQLMIDSPLISHDRKQAILKKIFDSQFSEIMDKFVDIVCSKAREFLLPSVAEQFIVQYNAVKGIQKAKVITAVALTDEMRAEFNKAIKEYTGKQDIDLEEVVDESLIGGFVLQVGDKQIDDSVSGRLEDLRAELLA